MDSPTLNFIAKIAGPAATILASFTAAGVAAYFARHQVRIARDQAMVAKDKLALDLFQRRIEVFGLIRTPIAKIMAHGASSPTLEHQLLQGIDTARWLFGSEVKSYLDELYDHLVYLDECNLTLKDANLSAEDRGKTVQSRREHLDAITGFYKRIDELFGPYLSATNKFASRPK